MRRRSAILIFLFFCAFPVLADSPERVQIGGTVSATMNEFASFYDEIGFAATYSSEGLDLFGDFSFRNDGKYSSEEPQFMLGHYIDITAGAFSLNIPNMQFLGGRYPQQDMVKSPYSLFLSGRNHTALGARFEYTSDRFYFETRWIRLNERAEDDRIPDRGMNYKVFGFRYGDLSVGFQDAVVYVHRSFDADYFFNVLPQYGTQLITSVSGRPWAEEGNTNNLMGLYAIMDSQRYYLYAQFLLDDADFLFFLPDSRQNPWKVAWSLGGSLDSHLGTWGVYTAGATMYTFERTYSGLERDYERYEYTYYPVTEYMLADGTWMPILFEDNYIGFRYGEDSLAFLISYQNSFFSKEPYNFDLYVDLEYVAGGIKSPSNEWQDLPFFLVEGEGIGTHWLDGGPLSQSFLSSISLRSEYGDFSFEISGRFGAILNPHEFVASTDGGEGFFRPTSDTIEGVMQLTLSVGYSLSL